MKRKITILCILGSTRLIQLARRLHPELFLVR